MNSFVTASGLAARAMNFVVSGLSGATTARTFTFAGTGNAIIQGIVGNNGGATTGGAGSLGQAGAGGKLLLGQRGAQTFVQGKVLRRRLKRIQHVLPGLVAVRYRHRYTTRSSPSTRLPTFA